MITFFYQNKGSFKVCEDSLTSTAFDLLKYLPIDIFWNIFRKSLYHQKLPEISGEILELSFWSKWNANETNNIRYVEPDVFIRFRNFDVIIEAKRYNENQQKEQQISNEIQSYFNEFGENNKDLYFVQLGGLLNLDDEENLIVNNKKVVLCKTDWTKLLDQIVLEKNKLKNIDYPQINSFKRIFEDLIKGFEIHSFFKKIWLESLKTTQILSHPPKTLFNYVNKY